MSKSNAVGTKLNVKSGGNSTSVGGVTSINGIEISAESIDVTALDNATGYREKEPGFKEVGDVTLDGFLDGADNGQELMYTLLNSQAQTDFEIVFPAKIGKTWSFSGYVSGFSTSADVGDAVKFGATIIVTGHATLAASSVSAG